MQQFFKNIYSVIIRLLPLTLYGLKTICRIFVIPSSGCSTMAALTLVLQEKTIQILRSQSKTAGFHEAIVANCPSHSGIHHVVLCPTVDIKQNDILAGGGGLVLG